MKLSEGCTDVIMGIVDRTSTVIVMMLNMFWVVLFVAFVVSMSFSNNAQAAYIDVPSRTLEFKGTVERVCGIETTERVGELGFGGEFTDVPATFTIHDNSGERFNEGDATLTYKLLTTNDADLTVTSLMLSTDGTKILPNNSGTWTDAGSTKKDHEVFVATKLEHKHFTWYNNGDTLDVFIEVTVDCEGSNNKN